ncbi:MAG: MATE family efflux transporter [Eubacterium sp.]|nr:MATE family efflux transporter [Eubacterium sp.]
MKNGIIKNYIGNSKFYRMVLGVAIPIMIQNGITNFVNLLDNIMVGRLSTEQMSGVAIVNQLIFIYYLCMFGGLSGVGIFTAQYFGYKDEEGIRHTIRYKMWLGFIISILVVVILMSMGSELINIYLQGTTDSGDPVKTLDYGMQYLGVILFMFPAVYIGFLLSSTLRECGETVLPMKAGIAAIFVNLCFNYLLIYGKFGFPRLGVRGAAAATVLSKYVEMGIILIWCMKNTKKHSYFHGLFRTILIPWKLVLKFLKTGMPLLLNEGLWALGVAMLAQAYSLRGLDVVAGQNIANTINNIFNIVFIALGDAVAIIIGQYLGAGKLEEAKDADRKIIAMAVASSVVIGLLMFSTSGLFPRIYNTSDASKKIATLFIMVQAIFLPKDAFLHTAYFTLRSGGKTIITFFFDSVFMLVISVPVAYLLTLFTGLHVAVIFAAVHAADLIKCVIGYVLVKKGVWVKNIVKEETTA